MAPMRRKNAIKIEQNRSKKENVGILAWGRVKDMIRHFISCRSDFHVRP